MVVVTEVAVLVVTVVFVTTDAVAVTVVADGLRASVPVAVVSDGLRASFTAFASGRSDMQRSEIGKQRLRDNE